MIKSILVIDDSSADQLLTEITIEEYDPSISILQAYDGREGLDMLAKMATPPDVILLDINMPGMNGHDFLEEYSKQKLASCVVMMLTSSMQDKDRERCLKYDFVRRYIDKPLDSDDLDSIAETISEVMFPTNSGHIL